MVDPTNAKAPLLASDIDPEITGDEYIQRLRGIRVQLDQKASRTIQPGKTWTAPGNIPDVGEVTGDNGAIALDKLRSLGLMSGHDDDTNDQILLDVQEVIRQLWGPRSWTAMLEDFETRKPKRRSINTCVAMPVYFAWKEAGALSDHESVISAIEDYVNHLHKAEIKKYFRRKSRSPVKQDHASKGKKRARKEADHKTVGSDGPSASKKPKRTEKAIAPHDAMTTTSTPQLDTPPNSALPIGPDTSTQLAASAQPDASLHLAAAAQPDTLLKLAAAAQSDPRLHAALVTLLKHSKVSRRENFIDLQFISLTVSGDAEWDGTGPAPSTHHSTTAILRTITDIPSCKMAADIIRWLLGPDVAWNPKTQFIVLLSSGGAILNSPDDDIDRLSLGVINVHQENGTMFKMKIVDYPGAVEDSGSVTPPADVAAASFQAIDEDLPIGAIRRSAYDNHEFDNQPASFLDQIFDTEDENLILLPPPLTSAEDMDTTYTRFTKDEYNRARAVFNLPPVRRFKAELIRIPWIRRTLWSHQLIWIVQGMDKFEDLPAHWLADEQGLGKTMEGTAILWAHNVVLLMDRSIDEWRRNPEKAHRSHCAPDAPTGTKCPSQSSWPIRCKCEPGSPTRNWKSANKPSLVVCMVKSTIGDWAKEVGTFCSDDAPFALLPIICHGSEKSSGGSTTVLKGNGRPKISYNDTVEAADLICGENGRYAKTVCDHILITSEQSIGSYVLNPLGLTDKNGKATKRPPDFQIGLVDESHQATGAGSGFAKALKLLASSAKPIESVELDDNGEVPSKDRPIKFVFMSGTMFAEVANLAPYWVVIQNLVQSLQAVWKHEKDTTRLDRAKKRHTRILDCDIATAKVTYTKPAEGSGERGEVEMDSNIGKILADISIRRRQNTRIPEQRPFNTPLVLLPAVHDLVKNVSYPPEVLKTCNDRLVNLSKKILKDRKGKSKKITTIERELINQSHTVQILGSLPSLYGMMSDFDGWKQSLTQINMNTKFGGVKYLTTSLDDNPLRKKVRDTCSNDPKIRTLRSLIDAVLATDATRNQDMDACRQKDPESFPGAAADYSEKIIVTAQNTFTAMATYDILQKAYPHIGIALHHSVLGDKEKEAIIKGFTDEKDAEGQFKQTFRPRILVAVQFPISTGLNLQRANVIIALEPCSSPTQESQMRCRVLRIGQRRECYIYRFYVKGLKFEDVVTNRRTRREMLKEAAYSTETLMED